MFIIRCTRMHRSPVIRISLFCQSHRPFRAYSHIDVTYIIKKNSPIGGVCRRLYFFCRRLQFSHQIQTDFRRKNSVLGGEIVHTLVFICGGDHRANPDTVDGFIKGKICPTRIFHLYKQTLCTVLDVNIYMLVTAFLF